MDEILSWRVRAGEPVAIPGGTLTPYALYIRMSIAQARLVWTMPVHVDIRRGAARVRVPVVDVTRWGVWGLRALALLAGVWGIRAIARGGASHG